MQRSKKVRNDKKNKRKFNKKYSNINNKKNKFEIMSRNLKNGIKIDKYKEQCNKNELQFIRNANEIINEFNNKCDSNHIQCQNVQKKIIQCINENGGYPNNFIDRYISYLTRNRNIDNLQNLCIFNVSNYIDALDFLMLKQCPNNESLNILGHYGNVEIFNIIKKFNYKIPPSVFNNCMHRTDPNRNKICLFLSNYNKFKPTKHNFELAIINNNEDIVYNLFANNNLMPNDDLIDMIIKYENIKLINLLIDYGLQLKEKHLQIACETGNYEIIKLFLLNGLAPTKDCLTTILSRNALHFMDASHADLIKNIDLLMENGFFII